MEELLVYNVNNEEEPVKGAFGFECQTQQHILIHIQNFDGLSK